MIEAAADLWELARAVKPDAVCVTTNGSVGKDGRAIMPGGVAGQAARQYPSLPAKLGADLAVAGTRVVTGFALPRYESPPWSIVAFPTIHKIGQAADLALVARSLAELVTLADWAHFEHVVLLPRPGTGIGGLDWRGQVKPLCDDLLDDRFLVVRYHDEAL
jgi:O-acetyl-ADP-ribose deacetylase (regulator of RNase III)